MADVGSVHKHDATHYKDASDRHTFCLTDQITDQVFNACVGDFTRSKNALPFLQFLF